MDKKSIQKFAVWARNELIAQVSQRAYQYGIEKSGYGDISADTVNGRILTVEEKAQRQQFIRQIEQKGFEQAVEEVAYTWFNRFIALRYMEINNYLPTHIRIFSDTSGAFRPEILNDALHIDLPGLDTEKVAELIEKNDTEALYRYLLLVQCNALNQSLPLMFEKMGAYTELLLPNNILRQDSVIGRMISDIPEEDWTDQVQIIGWLYQYYNTDLKDDTFAKLKKNVKITAERIPAATQLFTPHWIVCYMVENSLGRLWLEGHPNEELRKSWKYYLDEAKQEAEVEAELTKIREEYQKLKPEDIKLIDPCMGSGHILIYAFDVLMQIYESAGWNQRDAVQSILQNNLYGLEIDKRAAQFAYFAVMMKARQYDRRILTREIPSNLFVIQESNDIHASVIEYFHQNDSKLKESIEAIVQEMYDATEYGSLTAVTEVDFKALYERFEEIKDDINMMKQPAMEELLPLVECAELLARKYDVVVTNPPYMGSSGMNSKLAGFVKKFYPDAKSDLFAVFIERCGDMTAQNRYQAMITQQAWMFLSSFEKLRVKLLQADNIMNMAHLGARAFEEIAGEVVQTTAFVLRNGIEAGYKGTYCRLIEPVTQQGKEELFLAGKERYQADQENFSKIPGSPVAYWVSDTLLQAFSYPTMETIAQPRQGLATGCNDVFIRQWYEVNDTRINYLARDKESAYLSKAKWFPYNKGGEFRRWYGNNDFVVNWENDGYEIKHFTDENGKLRSRPQNTQFYFQECISWSLISSARSAFRYKPFGFIFDVSGMSCFAKKNLLYLLALCNSPVADAFLMIFSPTINFQVGDIANIPVVINERYLQQVEQIVQENINISKVDWDSNEVSWDFKRDNLA